MDLVTQTSLEALLLKATNSQNENVDSAAVEAICTLINKEKDGALIGVKVFAAKLPSSNERELLQTLNILDTCMNRCGSSFQSEIGKFRFLNEMIKLVSPKYLGSHTPLSVKQRVLQLLYLWTLDYPKESKIKEAFDMLRKQGVVKEIPNPNIEPVIDCAKRRTDGSIFHDEEKSKILQKLLQSKDPEDIQAANWLIKSMVKEDDKRAELKSKRFFELESVQNNVRLLNEMLDCYKSATSSSDELDLIKELHQSCERLQPNIVKLLSESKKNDDILTDALQLNDELNQVFNKYKRVVNNVNNSLLDFEHTPIVATAPEKVASNSIDVLCDIFTSVNIPEGGEVLQPEPVLPKSGEEVKDKLSALEELDVLGEHLLKENLSSSTNFKSQDKIPMNLLTKISEIKQSQLAHQQTVVPNFDLNYLVNKSDESRINALEASSASCLLDLTDEKLLDYGRSNSKEEVEVKMTENIKLNDINIKLENIKPLSTMEPMKILDEKNGVNCTLHFTKDKPKEHVHVFVITTISKNELPLSNYLFQAVTPKGCKLRLQTPSATELPAYSPFLPPSALTQIMLIANPERVQICLKCIISYVMDEETITEMGEIENLPMNN